MWTIVVIDCWSKNKRMNDRHAFKKEGETTEMRRFMNIYINTVMQKIHFIDSIGRITYEWSTVPRPQHVEVHAEPSVSPTPNLH